MSTATGDLITRIYANFRGCDFRGEEINIVRSPDCLNVWRDYKETESIRTRPGMELYMGFTDPVYGIFFYKDMMLVHSGTKLYKVANGVKTALYSGLNAMESNGFVFENIWYFKDGKNYLQYDGKNISKVVGYIPATSIGRKPEGGGTLYEDINMLSPYRINKFCTDEHTEFVLDAQNIDKDFVPVITDYLGNVYDPDYYQVNYTDGIIQYSGGTFPVHPTDGADNVFIQFKKAVEGYEDKILKCTLLQVFDNRVFVSGNPDYPNTVWHCSLNDPTYFSDLDYYREGVDDAAVKGLVAGNNALWVFREPSDANTTVFYHSPTIDSEYGKIYPSQHSSITTGCIGKAVNFNDDIIFFSERGMEGISGDVTTEQAIAHRSSLVDRKMIAEGDYTKMVLAEWEGYLLVFIWNEKKKVTQVYLADSRTAFTYENHLEYDWFYWELDKKIGYAKVYDGKLYLCAEDGIYTLTDTEAHVESYWVTPKDKFSSPNKMKTTNKKGCTVEAEGEEISVYAKTDKEEAFNLIDTFYDVTDSFVCRIKKKKWKDVQIKFYSTKRFALETATLEAFIGGYLK